jgi:hypothetical protein
MLHYTSTRYSISVFLWRFVSIYISLKEFNLFNLLRVYRLMKQIVPGKIVIKINQVQNKANY